MQNMESCSGKRSLCGITEKDETDIHRLLIDAAQSLQVKCQLKSSDINEASKEIAHLYRKGEWRYGPYDGIDFNDVNFCCAYMQCYATCHAALTRHATLWFLRKMKLHDSKSRKGKILSSSLQQLLFETDCLKVVCAGGGSGNDFLGFCSAIESIERKFSVLDLTVVDLKHGWSRAFEEVMNLAQTANYGKVGTIFDGTPLTSRFVQADLADNKVEEMKYADLILMVKMLSNVSPPQKPAVLKNVFSSMKIGAILLLVDTRLNKIQEKLSFYKGDNKIGILFSEKKRKFKHSVRSPLRMIPYSTYEICVLQKENEIQSSDEEESDDNNGNNEYSTSDEDENEQERIDDNDEDENEQEETDDNDDDENNLNDHEDNNVG